ncbi:MAG: hypothetical protein AAFR21_14025 [Pseudomonadota bacterium]
MIKAQIMAFLALVAASCATVPKSPEISSAEVKYFPDATFDETIENVFLDGKHYRDWYSNHLAALQEPSLYQADGRSEKYLRFVWLRTFHNPVAIRVEFSGKNTARLFFKLTDGAGGYVAGELVEEREKELDNSQIEKLLSAFTKINVCGQPTEDDNGYDGALGIDPGPCACIRQT